jgi:TetR/AcrR family transcriptional regulator
MKDTREKILQVAIKEYVSAGDDSLSMRNIAKKVPITQSVIYNYFESKEVLLKEMFTYSSKKLGELRAENNSTKGAKDLFRKRIAFQLENSDHIMVILKYFTDHPSLFDKNSLGYLPDNAALHIEEVLEAGMKEGIYKADDLKNDAKVIAHSINGFVTEYHGREMSEKENNELIERIATFFERGLRINPNI